MFRPLLIATLILPATAVAQEDDDDAATGGSATVTLSISESQRAYGSDAANSCDDDDEIEITITESQRISDFRYSSQINGTWYVFWDDSGECTGDVPSDPYAELSTTAITWTSDGTANFPDDFGDIEPITVQDVLTQLGACGEEATTTDQETRLCFAYDYLGGNGTLGTSSADQRIDLNGLEPYGWVRFVVDTSPPADPTIKLVEEGEGRLKVKLTNYADLVTDATRLQVHRLTGDEPVDSNEDGDPNTGGDADAGGDAATGGDSVAGDADTGGDTDTGGDADAGGDADTGGDADAGGDADSAGDPDSTTAALCESWPMVDSKTVTETFFVSAVNGVQTSVCVVAVDAAGNRSNASNVIFGEARQECDFIECYPGTEEPGYCGVGAGPLLPWAVLMLLWRRRKRC